MSNLLIGLMGLCKRNPDGSYATQSNRRSFFRLIDKQLAQEGVNVRHMRADQLRGKTVNILLRRWRRDGISDAVIKNRMAGLRWWAEKVGNPGAIKSNDELGIGRRQYATNENKASELAALVAAWRENNWARHADLSAEVWASVRLQIEFGLRREEAMKFQVVYALHGQKPETVDKIKLKGSWTKGGKDREIRVRTASQRALLAEIQRLAGNASLIPAGRSYVQHMRVFERETRQVGIGRTHGLRHYYAQQRYLELTGWDCRAVAGVDRKFDDDQLLLDRNARMIISVELGHERIGITSTYLGKIGK